MSLGVGCGAKSGLTRPDEQPPVLGQPRCPAGFAECDNDPTTVCDTEVASDNGNCGGCGLRCPAALVCGAGRCTRPGTIVEVLAGTKFSCARASGGTTSCWGANEVGTLGDGTWEPKSRPTAVVGLKDARQLVTNGYAVCARRADHSVACWGDNSFGQLGDSDPKPRSAPIAVPALPPVKFIGPDVAALRDGRIFAWARRRCGEPGDLGDPTAREVPGLLHVAALTSQGTKCALEQFGTVSCWGFRNFGLLGDGKPVPSNCRWQDEPTKVVGVADARDIDLAGFAACALVASTPHCWGSNEGGKFGLPGGSAEPDGSVLRASGIGGLRSIRLGLAHACGIDSERRVRCWGRNDRLALGISGTTGTSGTETVVVPGTERTVDLSVGSQHACAVNEEGAVRCWGNNQQGQIGDGTLSGSRLPTIIGL